MYDRNERDKYGYGFGLIGLVGLIGLIKPKLKRGGLQGFLYDRNH